MTKPRVLFVCTHNSARSQMAEGLLRVHPLAIRAMADRGIDISGHTSKTLDRVMQEPWDHVITVCDDANERCPFLPGTFARLHWPFEDPSRAVGTEQERLALFHRVREEIEGRLLKWLPTT